MKPQKIRQLDEATIGFIAAGEVVERPAQVVKELVENSLDAGATSITITVEGGGFDRLSVEDNGSGIDRDDLPLALDRHATSKLRTKDDLPPSYPLVSEAKPWRASAWFRAANLEQTRRRGGACIVMEDGVKSAIQPMGMGDGTLLTVEHLFRNTPARLAFQRRPETETARIVDVVVDHALAHPGCAFHLRTEQRTLLNVPATDNMLDRLYDIMGAQATELVPLQQPPVDDDAPGAERWSGWNSTPDITRGKGDDIHILINNRPVGAGPFLQAIRRGYKTRLMQGRHPLAVVNLDCPPDEVDVNVHPTKREVRLRHSWRVLERLERAIAYTLETVPTEPDATGGIPGLQGLATQQQVKSVETYLNPPTDNGAASALASAAGMEPTVTEPAPNQGSNRRRGPSQRANNSTWWVRRRTNPLPPSRIGPSRPHHSDRPCFPVKNNDRWRRLCHRLNATCTVMPDVERRFVRAKKDPWKANSTTCLTWNRWHNSPTRTFWCRPRMNCCSLTSTPFTRASGTSVFAIEGKRGNHKRDSNRLNSTSMLASPLWLTPITVD